MSTTNTGGPAFPGPYASENGNIEVLWKQQGMTLRDYFAAKAMQSILQAKDVHDSREWNNTAWIAYQVSDEMLKAREA
jgi:hypothetical protein